MTIFESDKNFNGVEGGGAIAVYDGMMTLDECDGKVSASPSIVSPDLRSKTPVAYRSSVLITSSIYSDGEDDNDDEDDVPRFRVVDGGRNDDENDDGGIGSVRSEPSQKATKATFCDEHLAFELIDMLAYLLTNSKREEARTEAEKSTMTMKGLMQRGSFDMGHVSLALKNDIIDMMGTTCGLLEMMFRRSIADQGKMYDSMGTTVILLLLQVVDRCFLGSDECNGDSTASASTDDNDAHASFPLGARACIDRAMEIFCHFARVPSARSSMRNLPGLLSGVTRIASEGRTRLPDETTASALRVVENLSRNGGGLNAFVASDPDLLGALASSAELPERRRAGAEPPGGGPAAADAASPSTCSSSGDSGRRRWRTRRQAVRALMNLAASSERTRAWVGGYHKGRIARIMLDVIRWDDSGDLTTRRCAAATLANLARSRENVAWMIRSPNGGGEGSSPSSSSSSSFFLGEMVRAVRDGSRDDGDDDDGRINNNLLETLRLLAAHDYGAEAMCSNHELLEALVNVAENGRAGENSAALAASTLKHLAKRIKALPMDSDSGSIVQEDFISSLVRVIVGADRSSLDVLCRIGEAIADQSLVPMNHAAMVREKDMLRALWKLSSVEGTALCAKASLTVLRSLADEGLDRGLLATESAVDTMANILCSSDLEDADLIKALSLVSGLVSKAACRRLMCRNQRLMVALMTHATKNWSQASGSEAESVDFTSASLRDTIVMIMSDKDERDI